MSNLKKTEKNNPRLEIYEIVQQEDDYSLVIGKLGEEDNPHYLLINHKYGVLTILSNSTGRPKVNKPVKPQTSFEFN
jgi:hypothetical protein